VHAGCRSFREQRCVLLGGLVSEHEQQLERGRYVKEIIVPIIWTDDEASFPHRWPGPSGVQALAVLDPELRIIYIMSNTMFIDRPIEPE
jgi:hypothetical protein